MVNRSKHYTLDKTDTYNKNGKNDNWNVTNTTTHDKENTTDLTEPYTNANVNTNIVQHVNTTTNTTENEYEDITEDNTTEMRPTLTEDLLLNVLNTNTDILRKTDSTEDTADTTDFIKVPWRRKKKKTDTDDETEKKRKAVHTYKIDIDNTTQSTNCQKKYSMVRVLINITNQVNYAF